MYQAYPSLRILVGNDGEQTNSFAYLYITTIEKRSRNFQVLIRISGNLKTDVDDFIRLTCI